MTTQITDSVVHIHHVGITYDYIILGLYILINAAFIYRRWDWIQKALSDGDAPSSKRLVGFLSVQAVLLCELYHTIKSETFELYHLIMILSFATLCFGLATTTDIINAIKGNKV